MNVQPVRGPFVWDKRTTALEQILMRMPPEAASEVTHAARKLSARSLRVQDVRRTDFEVPASAALLKDVRRELEHGRGFVILKGLNLGGLTETEMRLLYWGICTHIGIPLSQSKNGEFIGEVRDIGVKTGQADSRAYRTGGELRFHMDRCDVLGLLCVRDAQSGGLSKAVSSAAVHNEVLKRRPELMETLYSPYHFSRQSEQLEGEKPWFSSPIYSIVDGKFMSQFSLTYVESAQRYDDVPRLTPRQDEALRYVASVAEELCTTFRMEPGDIQLVNNHVMYHSRTNYQDFEEPEKKRFLMRMWLATPNSRPLPKEREEFWGASEPGVPRGGVQPPTGPRYAFPDWSTAGWTSEAMELA